MPSGFTRCKNIEYRQTTKAPITTAILKFPTLSLFFLLICLVTSPCMSRAQISTPLAKLIMTIGAISEREGVVYVAQDQGFFRKHGLDLTLVQVRNGGVGITALSSGESQVHWGSVSAANIGAIAEGADLVFIAGFINK